MTPPRAANDAPMPCWLSKGLQDILARQHAMLLVHARSCRAMGAADFAAEHLDDARELRAELTGHGCEMLAARLAREAEAT